MKSKIFILLAVFITALILQSCEESTYLDTKPLSAISGDAVFTDPSLARASLLAIYVGTPCVFWRFCATPLDLTARDGIHTFEPLASFVYNASTYFGGFGGDFWYKNYIWIRRANVFLNGVKNSSFDEETKKTFIAEARFLRATFYLDLYRFYRGVPIITEAQSLDDNAAYNLTRNTADETVNFVVSELTEAIKDLKLEWTNDDRGRATKGAGYAIMARALLYAASLNNNTELFKQTAEAADAVIKLNKYSLYPDFNKMFLAKADNNEFIFYYHYVPSNNLTDLNNGWFGNGGWNTCNSPESGGGWGGALPSQNLVDEFEMIDGQLPENSTLYEEQDPYKNRDPRFDASIYHQGSTYKGVPLEFFNGGKDYIIGGYTTTGYYIRKGIDESIVDQSAFNWAAQDQYDPYLRYADVLLMYAEAQNEVAGPDASVYDAINQVRERAGMPDIPAGLSKDEMRGKIRHERRVELCFEESYYHDIRRWGITHTACDGPIYGVGITKNPDNTLSYQKQIMETRIFNDRYVLWPVPQSERDKNPNLTQNPGY